MLSFSVVCLLLCCNFAQTAILNLASTAKCMKIQSISVSSIFLHKFQQDARNSSMLSPVSAMVMCRVHNSTTCCCDVNIPDSIINLFTALWIEKQSSVCVMTALITKWFCAYDKFLLVDSNNKMWSACATVCCLLGQQSSAAGQAYGVSYKWHRFEQQVSNTIRCADLRLGLLCLQTQLFHQVAWAISIVACLRV